MPVISHGTLHRALKTYMGPKDPHPSSSFTNAGYSVVKPMQLPGLSAKEGPSQKERLSGDESIAAAVDNVFRKELSQPVGGSKSGDAAGPLPIPRDSRPIVNPETFDLGRLSVAKVTDDYSLRCEGHTNNHGNADPRMPLTARGPHSPHGAKTNSKSTTGNRRDSVRWNSLAIARERAAEEDKMANRSVKKIEIALRHMNDQKLELADMKNQMQALLKPQLKLERTAKQLERAKTAAQIMAPLQGQLQGLLPRKKSDPKDFFNDGELTEEEKDLRALSKKTGIDLPDVQDYKKWFDKVDIDGSGVIERAEFDSLMKELHPGVDLRKQQVEEWWRGVDEDQSGEVTFEEFIMYWATHGD